MIDYLVVMNMKKFIVIMLIFLTSINLVYLNKNNYCLYKKTNYKLSEKTYKIASIEILNTDFKRTLVQTTDNKFFLSHDVDGNKSNLGSVFLDYRNKINDKKLLVYGHNSKTIKEAPFHFLENYLNFEFGKKYNKLVLKVDDQNLYYQLFTVIIVTDDFQHINLNWSEEEYQNHLSWLKNESLFNYIVDITSTDSILVFQTCYYYPENSYLLIGWKKIS